MVGGKAMEKLNELYDELINEKNSLQKRLEEIEDELVSVSTVLDLIKKREHKEDHRQLTLIQDEESNEYADSTFKEAVLDLFKKHPEKWWKPKEITKTILKKGFKTKSKNFGNIVRAQLPGFREEELIEGEKVTIGKQEMWRYRHKPRLIKRRRTIFNSGQD